MTGIEMLNMTLDRLRAADHVADLAWQLVQSGVTIDQLISALRGRQFESIAIELCDKFRKITAGRTTMNQYGITREWCESST
jgi:hypothetical protein